MAPSEVTITVTTGSQVIPKGMGTPPTLPKIALNGAPLPSLPNPGYTSGFQVVVLDVTQDITQPAAILSNQYRALFADDGNSWWDTYVAMYDAIKRQILSSGNPEAQLVILASYGMDANAAPTPDIMDTLQSLGAGQPLQHWETSVDIGSGGGSFISWPANYLFIGRSQIGYGQATELFDFPGNQNPVQSSITATVGNV
jgi:hypothetical protein